MIIAPETGNNPLKIIPCVIVCYKLTLQIVLNNSMKAGIIASATACKNRPIVILLVIISIFCIFSFRDRCSDITWAFCFGNCESTYY